MPEARRLFFAVWPPPDAIGRLQRAIEPLRADCPDWLRWQAPERWHVTLLFLGDRTQDDRDLATVIGAGLAATTLAAPLAITGFGRFGSVLWAGVTGAEWLVPLHRDLRRRLQPRGERQRFRAHVTLARARSRRVPTELLDRLGSFEGPPWTPAELTLVASTIGPHPRYEVLEGFRFSTEG